MKLTYETMDEFIARLSSSAPTPGGGSAAAVQGAQGAALSEMVCALTLGKSRYAEYQSLAEEKSRELSKVKARLMELVERDVEAFGEISKVYAMPKNTPEEKNRRNSAMNAALKGGILPPLEVMECCLEGLEHTAELVGKSNVSASSDLGVAAQSFQAAIRSAWLNVVINANGIDDRDFVRECRDRGEAVLERALPLAEKIYAQVLRAL